MPFEFVCPFCYSRTRVADEYLGRNGPCANCGKPVTMPTRGADGRLIPAVQTGKAVAISTPQELPIDPATRRIRFAIGSSLAACGLILLLAGVFYGVPALRKRISIAAQSSDLDNLKQIAAALNAYEAKYGTYPPPVVTDAAGRKLYSWRVLILPFLGYEDEYKQFQLDQPWDSPANMAILRRMPVQFASSNSADASVNQETNYVLLTGTSTLFPSTGPLARTAVKDKPTLLVVETQNSGLVWTQPGDIDIDTMGLKIGNKGAQEIGGLHEGVVLAADTDEKQLTLPSTIPQIVLDALATPAGGESMPTNAFQSK
ncbi:MAG: DUF1559 domain-containing protein [Pirellula sp.]